MTEGQRMEFSGRHCPFLNRQDARCTQHLSLGALGHAYEHCFDQYAGCTVYYDLVVERKGRQGGGDAVEIAGRDKQSAAAA